LHWGQDRLSADFCGSVSSALMSGLVAWRWIVERARRGVQPCFGDVQVAGGRLQIAVAEQKLDATQIGACIKQMCGEGVTQYMRAERPKELLRRCLIGRRRRTELDVAGFSIADVGSGWFSI
jgi:hypothetical protein